MLIKKRWLTYAIIGILFGIVDVYIQRLIAPNDGYNSTWSIYVAYAVWLITGIPIAINEILASNSKIKSMLATVYTWSISVISYYIWELSAELVGFFGVRERLNYFTHHNDDWYWSETFAWLKRYLLGNLPEWLVVAILGGAIVGFITSFIVAIISKSREQ